MSRGVDLDVIAIKPAQEATVLLPLVDKALAQAGYDKLSSIDEIKLDLLNEWLHDGERCVALTQTRGGWQYLYDTTFSTAELAGPLSRQLPASLVLQMNLQEQTDFTLRVLQGGEALAEVSRGADFFARPQEHDRTSVRAWDSAQAPALAALLKVDAPELAASVALIAKGEKGERTGKGPRVHYAGGVQDAVQEFAAALGMPHVYRFFEGWMKSDLDWAEDEVVTVHAYRRRTGS